MEELEVFTDGACSGNPGEAAIGVVIKNQGKVVKEIAQAIGPATNNIAEYTALIEALHAAKKLGALRLLIHTDSELMFKQIRGVYQVKAAQIKPLYEQVMGLLKNFTKVELKWVPREKNIDADRLAQGVLKTKTGQGDRPDAFVIGEESPSSKG